MDGSTICLSILALVLGAYYLLCKNLNYFKDTGIPHIPPKPIVGNLGPVFFRRTAMTDLVQKIYNLNPDAKYVGLYSLSVPIVMIRDPEIIKSIGVKNFDSFPNHRTDLNDDQDVLMSKNLVALRGKRWRDVRAILSPSFTTAKIRAMFKLMSSCATEFIESLMELPVDKRELDMKDIFTRYTNDVIARCAYGIKIDSMRNPQNDFYKYGKESTTFSAIAAIKILALTLLPKLSKWLGLRVIRREIAEFFQNVIGEIIETREKTGITQPDMIQVMMDSKKKEEKKDDLTLEDMTSQAFIFFFAGFETTASLLCFLAHEIAVNPNVQEKLNEEIDMVLEATDGDVSYEAINEMQYLDAVINETLRMYPIAFVTDRVCEKSFELPPALPGLKPHVLKEGANVWFPAYALHRDSKYFEEPDKFEPERFLRQDKKIFNSGVYIPFGIGPRMCIGNRFALLEIKVLFFYLLARCELKPCSKTTVPFRMSKKTPMYADGGFWLEVQERRDYQSCGLKE